MKCLATELVDTEVARDAYEANKFYCQAGAESLYERSNEPGENVKQGEDETDSVIHQLFNLADF